MGIIINHYSVLIIINHCSGWVAGGCWDDDMTSDEMDHSREFPAFSTSKSIPNSANWLLVLNLAHLEK